MWTVGGYANDCEHSVLRAVAEVCRRLHELTEEERGFQRGSASRVVWDAQDLRTWVGPENRRDARRADLSVLGEGEG